MKSLGRRYQEANIALIRFCLRGSPPTAPHPTCLIRICSPPRPAAQAVSGRTERAAGPAALLPFLHCLRGGLCEAAGAACMASRACMLCRPAVVVQGAACWSWSHSLAAGWPGACATVRRPLSARSHPKTALNNRRPSHAAAPCMCSCKSFITFNARCRSALLHRRSSKRSLAGQWERCTRKSPQSRWQLLPWAR